MTNLTQALKDNGLNQLVFKSDCLGHTATLAVEDIPDSSIIALLQYGTRKINDQFNSGKTKHGQTLEYFETLLEAVKNGTLAERKSGGLSTDDKAIRGLILDWLRGTCKVPAGRIKEVQSLTPAAVLDEIFSDKDPIWRDDVLGRFITKWNRIKAISAEEDDIEI